MRRRSVLLPVLLSAAVHGVPPSAAAQVAGTHGEIQAVTGAVVYPAPDAAPIEDGVILMRDGKIVAAGRRDSMAAPPGAATLDGTGLFVVAGFQNSHVHFTEPKWNGAPRCLPSGSRQNSG